MNKTFKKFAKRILFIPIIRNEFKKIFRFYMSQPRNEEYLLDVLNIRECLTDEDAKALMTVVNMVLEEGIRIVEVGSWKGFSTYFLAKAVLGRNGKIFAVDHWKGSEGVAVHEEAERKDVFTIFKHNMIILKVDKVVEPLRMDSLVAAKRFKDQSLDLVFLDADHRYENFKKDINAWFPKIKRGGIICGHDCEGYYGNYPKELKEKIDKSLKEDFILNFGHPGIIKGLYEFFGEEYSITPNSSIWYYKKT